MAAAAALAGTQTALAVIPSGTGNLLALNLRLPADVVSAVRVVTRGDRRNIDLGEADGRLFAVAAGIGLDAQILAETPRRAKHRLGWPAYAAAALRHLGEPRFPAKVSLDGGTPIEREVRSVLVANVGRLPGGINLLPEAVADDGLLDVALIAPRRLHDWARLLTSLMGRHPTGGRLETFRARRVDITTSEPQPREMDGEPLPPGELLAVRIRPNALTVCVGRNLPTSR
jgi:diacylglycerol kinase family enzyme